MKIAFREMRGIKILLLFVLSIGVNSKGFSMEKTRFKPSNNWYMSFAEHEYNKGVDYLETPGKMEKGLKCLKDSKERGYKPAGILASTNLGRGHIPSPFG